mgnify:CR=1 FL=1
MRFLFALLVALGVPALASANPAPSVSTTQDGVAIGDFGLNDLRTRPLGAGKAASNLVRPLVPGNVVACRRLLDVLDRHHASGERGNCLREIVQILARIRVSHASEVS